MNCTGRTSQANLGPRARTTKRFAISKTLAVNSEAVNLKAILNGSCDNMRTDRLDTLGLGFKNQKAWHYGEYDKHKAVVPE